MIPFLFFLPPTVISFPLVQEAFVSFSKQDILFSISVTTITSVVVIWTNFYMKEEPSFGVLNFGIVSFATSMLFLILSGDPVMAIIGFDLLGATSFFLILFYKSWNSINGALVTLLMNKVGDVALILSTLNLLFPFLLWSSPASILLFCLAAGIKAAQIPFNTWLPLAMEAPTPVSSLVHSSTLVTAGIYLMMKLHYESESLFWISFVTLLLSSFLALLEKDVKKVVALSTMSQMSLIIISLSLGKQDFAFFHLLTHSFFKSLLFICVGNILNSSLGNQTLSLSTKTNKMNSFLMFICLLNLTGLAFSSGFNSKELILSQFEKMATTPMLISSFLMILTFLYCCRLWSFFSSLFFTNFFPAISLIFFSFLSVAFGFFFCQENQMVEGSPSPHLLSSFLILTTLILILTKSTSSLNNSIKISNKSINLFKKTWKLNPSDTTLYSNLMKINSLLFSLSSLLSFLSISWFLIIFMLTLCIF